MAATDDGDAIVFNNEIYVTNDTNIDRYNGSSENSVSSGLTSNKWHLLEVFSPDGSGERLYVTEGDDKVWSVSQANALATSSTYTLDLSLEPNYQITAIRAGTDRLWIAVSSAGNNVASGDSYVFTWDGVTANSPIAKYRVNTSRIMSLVVKDDIPYIMTQDGRLMAWNGGVFQELDRLPIDKPKLLIASSSTLRNNGIHPKGMTVDKDEILINVSNLAEGSTGSTTFYHNFPAGVWAYSQRNGLYHKYSPSYQAVADTGTTNLADYGQFRAGYAYPVVVQDINTLTATDGGRVMFGMSYFTNASDSLSSNLTYGIFTDDTADDTQKAGYFVTPQVYSSVFRDNWQEIYASLSELETAGDLVQLKYRTTDEDPTYADITWKSTTTFHTTADLTGFEQGDEIQVVQGNGGGAIRHMESEPDTVGVTITLDEAVTGVSNGDTAVIKVQKFKKISSFSDLAPDKIGLGVKSNYVQFKVFCQWTGPREFYNLLINNSSSISQ